MMDFIKRTKWAYILVSCALIVFGLCLVIWPNTSAQVICVALGILLALFGAVKLFGYFSKDRFGLAFQFDFALGIITLVAGILVLLHPAAIVNALPIVLGVFILIDGAFKIQTAIDAKRFGLSGWWVILVLALVSCAFGLLLALNPFEGAAALAILLGVSLMVDGIQNLIVVIYTVRTVKQIRNSDIEIDL